LPDADIRYLYKYRSLSGRSAEFVERLLLHDELYFPQPLEFNDPFDCCPVASLDVTEDQFTNYLDGLYKRMAPRLTRADRRRKVSDVLRDFRNHKSKMAIDVTNKVMAEAVNSAGVLSLSAKPDHVLMWSHYADSHRGICIRFQASSTTPFFGRAQRVIYQPDRPVLNVILDSRDARAEKALLTKADFWSYEEEWRIVEHEAGPGTHRFPASLLDAVILGARIALDDKERVLGLIRRRKTKAKILQAQIDAKKFRLTITTP
jgi:hypothetical protein